MPNDSLNRPLVSYVATQSALVLIILAATYLTAQMTEELLGRSVDHFWISLVLVVFAQLPIAVIYAKNECRSPKSGEAWALAIVFVCVTVLFEVLLVGSAGSFMQVLLPEIVSGAPMSAEIFGYVVCGSLLGFIVVSFVVKTLLTFSVKNNLNSKIETDVRTRVLSVLPGLKMKQPQGFFSKKGGNSNFAELYRRELIGANIGLFGLSLLVFGPEFLHVLRFSIPLSIVFSIVCVANHLAKSRLKTTLSERCLSISIELLPLTVTSLLLFAASEMYANFVIQNGVQISAYAYAEMLVMHTLTAESGFVQLLLFLGVVFALCLAANVLLLVVFTKLIRPLVRASLKTLRPVRPPQYDELMNMIGLGVPVPAKSTRPILIKELRAKRPVVSFQLGNLKT